MIEIRQRFTVSFEYPLFFTRDSFGRGDAALRSVLERAGSRRHRMLPVVDAGLLAADANLRHRLEDFAARHADRVELVAPPVVVRGGEAAKSDARDVECLHRLVADHELCRQSFLLAMGGGAVLDAAGFAASTAHRGVRLIRMPSTVLAQNDAGIGVKNGINAFGRKNFLGSFTPPFAVVNDFSLLETLPLRDRLAGMAEAVKVALIRDRLFFDDLLARRHQLRQLDAPATEWMIRRCAELHLEHVAGCGDPFEARSARPLDFGHWSAHALEELSKAELRHGEAVAIGIALDVLYCHITGRIPQHVVGRVVTLLRDLGLPLAHPTLRELDIAAALQSFREHLGGPLCITVIDDVGCPVEIHEVDADRMNQSRDALVRLLDCDEGSLE